MDDDYGDLHLQASSPAIDTGTNSAISLTVDLEGYPRILDGDGNSTAIVDMGAYEYLPHQILSVTLTGTGSGTVTGNGILCSGEANADCTVAYPYGSNVILSAFADPGSVFTGWNRVCSGSGVCDVNMVNPVEVIANFKLDTQLLFLPFVGNHPTNTISVVDQWRCPHPVLRVPRFP